MAVANTVECICPLWEGEGGGGGGGRSCTENTCGTPICTSVYYIKVVGGGPFLDDRCMHSNQVPADIFIRPSKGKRNERSLQRSLEASAALVNTRLASLVGQPTSVKRSLCISALLSYLLSRFSAKIRSHKPDTALSTDSRPPSLLYMLAFDCSSDLR